MFCMTRPLAILLAAAILAGVVGLVGTMGVR